MRGLVQGVCLALAISAGALAQGASAQTAASGLQFEYGLVPSDMVLSHPQSREERRLHPGDARKGRSHLGLSLFDAQSGERIAKAEVVVHITPAGGASISKALEPMDIGGKAGFGAFVPVGTPGLYKIRFDVQRPGIADTQSAEFEHRIAESRRK